MSNEVPVMIGKYKILGIIARGGMGVVYKAVHPSLKKTVVIKKLTAPQKSTSAERFKKEAEILMRLPSPYIVHVHDYFTEAGSRYIVEEFVEGSSLEKLLQKQISIPVPEAMLFMQDCCYALKFAHSNGVVHRDIKPGNILISKRGEIKIGDFGIARDENEEKSALGKTVTGISMGTPAYMSPEQFEDSSKVDNRADIYSLGVMLYEMVTGSKPYPAEFNLETLRIIKTGKYINPRRIDKSIPKSLCKLIHKMIRPKPQQRYQSIDKVLKAVKRYLKHYDTHSIRVQVAKSVVAQKQYAFAKIEPKDKIIRRIKKIIVTAASFFLIFAFLWANGFIHKTLLKHWYTPVNVQMIMPRSLSANMDLPARAFFFEDDNDKIPEVKGSTRNFYITGSRPEEKFINFFKRTITVERASSANKRYSIHNVYLKHGLYRVKVVVGPYVWWQNFEVGQNEVSLPCDFLRNTKRNLHISAAVTDSATGDDITGISKILVNYQNNWVLLEDLDTSSLSSGKVWRLRVLADGYMEKSFSLLVDWFQDDLVLSCQLKKNYSGL